MQHVDVEEALRGLYDAGDYDGAATLAIEAYGPEILRFATSQLQNNADARDVFSVFCEDLWRGFPGFSWRCTARAWAYTLARHAGRRFGAAPHRRRQRNLPLSEIVIDDEVRARTSTAVYQRTEVKNRFRELRERLGEEDQLILILKVDRGLGWSEIAHVVGAPDAPKSGAEIDREVMRLRKRFQLIKQRLRRWAEERGLFSEQGAA